MNFTSKLKTSISQNLPFWRISAKNTCKKGKNLSGVTQTYPMPWAENLPPRLPAPPAAQEDKSDQQPPNSLSRWWICKTHLFLCLFPDGLAQFLCPRLHQLWPHPNHSPDHGLKTWNKEQKEYIDFLYFHKKWNIQKGNKCKHWAFKDIIKTDPNNETWSRLSAKNAWAHIKPLCFELIRELFFIALKYSIK